MRTDRRGPPARRRSGNRGRRWPLFAAASLTILAGSYFAFRISAQTHAVAPAVPTLIDQALRLAGFGIDEVVLSGHRQTADRDIFEALDLGRTHSLASFDAEGVRLRLERLPWIAGAQIMRVYPNRLDVRVTERRPFATWRQGGREYLVDEGGRTLTEIHRSTGIALPHITGEGAPAEARALFETLARFPAIRDRLKTAERVGNRRWTLNLEGDVTLHLPPDQEVAALDRATSDPAISRFMTSGSGVVDLRVVGRVALRREAQQPAPGRAGS